MLAGTRCLFQPIETKRFEGTVYLITESSIEVVDFWPNEYIIAFVDADESSSRPARFLLDHPFVKIIAASSPNNAYPQWTFSPTFVTTRITTLWSPQELFLTGWVIGCKSENYTDILYRMFLAPLDLSYSQLRESTTYFGFNPRHCFCAPRNFYEIIRRTEEKIRRSPENMSLQDQIWSKICISHSVFQLSPEDGDDRRLLADATISAISPWALTSLLELYEQRQADASFKFYKSIRNTPNAGTIRGQMFQVQVLKHLGALKGQEQFTIRRLTDSIPSQWTYPGPTASSCCHSSTFPQLLEDAVTQRKSAHLVPQQPTFAALHSILYTPGDVLTGIYATVHTEHPVAVVGLQRIRSWLKRDSIFSNLEPSIPGNHWRLIFVVPEEIASTFQIQRLEGDTDSNEWSNKVDQYVLGINEDTLWGQLSSP